MWGNVPSLLGSLGYGTSSVLLVLFPVELAISILVSSGEDLGLGGHGGLHLLLVSHEFSQLSLVGGILLLGELGSVLLVNFNHFGKVFGREGHTLKLICKDILIKIPPRIFITTQSLLSQLFFQ